MGKLDYERKLRTELKKWEAEISRLQAKADSARAEARVKYLSEIDKLQDQKTKAEAQLEELVEAQEGAWEDMKSGIDDAWKSLGNAVNNAVERFK